MVYAPETFITTKTGNVSNNNPTPPIARTKDETTDVMIRRGNGIFESKYDLHV